jgi:hypothetical protein
LSAAADSMRYIALRALATTWSLGSYNWACHPPTKCVGEDKAPNTAETICKADSQESIMHLLNR